VSCCAPARAGPEIYSTGFGGSRPFAYPFHAAPGGALRLQGKIAAVTGGGKGLGSAIVKAFAREGADVAFSFHESREGAARVKGDVEGLGRRVFTRTADARAPRAMAAFVDEAASALGGLDILVNNVGIFRRVPLDELTEEVLDEAFAVNVKSAVLAARAAAPHMKKRGGGAIVNLGSLGGLRPWRKYLPYCTTKAALHMATACLALTLAPEIRVNAVAPGVLDPPGGPEAVKGRVPQGRFGSLDEAVECVMFFAAGGTYVTGEVLRVDGGRALV
jgi:NAD(P)-dependent dehydrogenase (short-subunit alcohol dehydrogenase family)